MDGDFEINGNIDVVGDLPLRNYSAAGSPTRLLGVASDGKIEPTNGTLSFHYLEVDSAIKVGDSSIYILGNGSGSPDNHIFTTHGGLVLNGIQGMVPQNTVINASGGNVGVGYNTTTIPNSAKFSVNGNSSFNGFNSINTVPTAGTRLGISATTGEIGLEVYHRQFSAGGTSIKDIVKNEETRAFSVLYDNGITTREQFVIFGNGITNIGQGIANQSSTQLNVQTGLDVGCRVKLTYPNYTSNKVAFLAEVPYFESKAISVISSAPNYTSGPREVFRVTGEGVAWMQEIRVRMAPFPDYVFEKDYSLMDLDSLEQYIAENHKLPGMPSADDVKAEDANLGELVRLQQEKIEELTLYLIEMKKEIEQIHNPRN